MYLLQQGHLHLYFIENRNGITIYSGQTTEASNLVPDPITLPRIRLT